MTEYERKLAAAMAEMAQTTMKRSNYNPPALRLQQRLGWEARPPHYATFWRITLGYALWFGTVWGIAMWFLSWRSAGFTVLAAVGAAALAGVLFGLIMAAYYKRAGRKHQLSRWEDL